MKKRTLAIILTTFLSASVLGGCSNGERGQRIDSDDNTQTSESQTLGREADNTEKADETFVSEDLPYEAMVIETAIDSDDLYDEDTGELLAELVYSAPVIISDGYDKLKGALLQHTKDLNQEINNQHYTMLKDIDAIDKNLYSSSCFPWADEYNYSMCRADSVVFSYWQSEYQQTNGPHPNYYYLGCNYDSQTGEKLSFKDIVTDYEGIYQYTMNYLDTYPYKDEFFDDYQKNVKDIFYGSNGSETVNFVLDNSGLCIEFDTYIVGTHALGPVSVPIPYSDCEKYIDSKYILKRPCTVETVETNEIYKKDFDGDGQEEELKLSAENIEDDGGVNITVEYGKADHKKSITNQHWFDMNAAYLMKSKSANWYLYVQIQGDNDYNNYLIYDLSKPKEGPIEMEALCSDTFYNNVPLDSSSFVMETPVDALGSYRAYRIYEASENMYPIATGETYYIKNYDPESFGEYFRLTAKEDIQGEDGTINKGEKCLVYSVEIGEEYKATSVVIKTESGKMVTIRIDRFDFDNYGYVINGKLETELFDGIMYAG